MGPIKKRTSHAQEATSFLLSLVGECLTDFRDDASSLFTEARSPPKIMRAWSHVKSRPMPPARALIDA